jgi:hypothetical protein
VTALGFIGLDVIARPMVEHLVKAAHDVKVHNRTRGPVQELVAVGALAGGGAGDGADAEVVIMVPDSPDAEEPRGLRRRSRDRSAILTLIEDLFGRRREDPAARGADVPVGTTGRGCPRPCAGPVADGRWL